MRVFAGLPFCNNTQELLINSNHFSFENNIQIEKIFECLDFLEGSQLPKFPPSEDVLPQQCTRS